MPRPRRGCRARRRAASPVPPRATRYAARTARVEVGAGPFHAVARRRRPGRSRRRRGGRARRRGRVRARPPRTRSSVRPASTPSARPTPWYASVDGVKRSLTTTLPAASAGRMTSATCCGAIGEHQQQLGARVELPVVVQQQQRGSPRRRACRPGSCVSSASRPVRARAAARDASPACSCRFLRRPRARRTARDAALDAFVRHASRLGFGARRMRRRAAKPDEHVIKPPSHSASRTPGSEIVHRPDRDVAVDPVHRTSRRTQLATNGPIVSESNRHRRTIV